ncbi:MAG TPA: hypothetical protein VF399_10420 [bacterium]
MMILVALIMKNRPKLLILFLSVLALTICSQNYNPKLPAYLKAEKELRSRVTPEQGLKDSIDMLAAKFNINPEREVVRFKSSPQSWVRLLNDIQGRKTNNKTDTTKTKNEKK